MPSPKHPANGWRRRWLETFSLRGLALLADSWSTDPPFKDDSGFGAAIAVYRQNILEHYGKLAAEQGNSNNLSAWFKQHRAVARLFCPSVWRNERRIGVAFASLLICFFPASPATQLEILVAGITASGPRRR
jgi:hypothetical protein